MRAMRLAALSAALLLIVTACSDDSAVTGTTSDCPREAVEGCDMLGIRFDPPLPLDEALAAAADAGGTAIAVYRTDYACVPEVAFSPVEEPGRVPSRFAYVDAPGIEERRIEAAGSGLAPPISGFHISQSYWDAWNAEWAAARRDGVLIEGVAIWVASDSAETALADPRVAATVPLSWRRTDSIDPSYSGELLMDSEHFPGLSTPPSEDC